jgi:ribonuclease P protein component
MVQAVKRIIVGPAHEIEMVERNVDQSFSKQLHLRSRAEFQQVMRNRRSVADAVLIVYGLRNELGYSRLGLAVSKKVGGAVVRNKWKRLIREVFRQERARLPVGLDFVVLPRAGNMPAWNRVRASFPQLAWRIAKRLDSEEKQS